MKFTNFDPLPTNLFGEPPKFYNSFGYCFTGPIARKSLDHAPTWVTTLGRVWCPQILMGVDPQILDQISKIIPISDLLSYKGCLSVERPRTFGGEKNPKINSTLLHQVRKSSAHIVPSTESLCEKIEKQISGWVRMRNNHVFHGNILVRSGAVHRQIVKLTKN